MTTPITDPEVFAEELKNKIAAFAGGELNAEALQRLSSQQITLWAYYILRDEVMDGGFVQLIVNGYAPFFFRNPFARAVQLWGQEELASIVKRGARLYDRHKDALTGDFTDEEFMALFEKFPDFDDLDDRFVENEADITSGIAQYVAEHKDDFSL